MSVSAWAHAFGTQWQKAWNSHDLDAILSHYAQDVRFCSKRAERLMGQEVIEGLHALRDYWRKALAQQPNLHFTIRHIYEGPQSLVIRYCTHRGDEISEVLIFNANGQIKEGYACAAIMPPDPS